MKLSLYLIDGFWPTKIGDITLDRLIIAKYESDPKVVEPLHKYPAIKIGAHVRPRLLNKHERRQKGYNVEFNFKGQIYYAQASNIQALRLKLYLFIASRTFKEKMFWPLIGYILGLLSGMGQRHLYEWLFL